MGQGAVGVAIVVGMVQLTSFGGVGIETARIAALLYLSEGNVRNYLSTAMAKLGESNRLAAVRAARQMGWTGRR